MFITELFKTEKSVQAVFEKQVTSVVDGQVTKTYSVFLTKAVLFWSGASADRFVSEKLRPKVEGVILMDYITTVIPDSAKVTIGGKEYGVIYSENIGNQDEVLAIPVKRFE